MTEIKARCWPADLPFINFAEGTVINGFAPQTKAGDFKFCGENGKGTTDPSAVRTMQFQCLKTGKYCGSIRVGFAEKPPGERTWAWDGNFEKPTLSPSINCVGCWHGWLQSGVFKDA